MSNTFYIIKGRPAYNCNTCYTFDNGLETLGEPDAEIDKYRKRYGETVAGSLLMLYRKTKRSPAMAAIEASLELDMTCRNVIVALAERMKKLVSYRPTPGIDFEVYMLDTVHLNKRHPAGCVLYFIWTTEAKNLPACIKKVKAFL